VEVYPQNPPSTSTGEWCVLCLTFAGLLGHKATKCWKAIYKGHALYLGYGTSSRTGNLSTRLGRFDILRAEIDDEQKQHKPHRAEHERAIQLRQESVHVLSTMIA